MSDIFISYAHEDKAKAKVLAEALERHAWSVWWDRDIPPGTTWAQHIERAIEESKCVVVLWSQASTASTWVSKEARYGEKRGLLIPALIEAAPIPFEFEHLQAANLCDWDGASPHAAFDELVNAVAARLGRPAPPALVQPAPPQALGTDKTDMILDRFAAIQHREIRWYATFASLLLVPGLLSAIVGIGFMPAGLLQTILGTGGPVVSSISALPIKEMMARKRKINYCALLRTWMMAATSEQERRDLERLILDDLKKHLFA